MKLIVKNLRPGTGAVLKQGSFGIPSIHELRHRMGQIYEDRWDNP
jgi:hypothetical protein